METLDPIIFITLLWLIAFIQPVIALLIWVWLRLSFKKLLVFVFDVLLIFVLLFKLLLELLFDVALVSGNAKPNVALAELFVDASAELLAAEFNEFCKEFSKDYL